MFVRKIKEIILWLALCWYILSDWYFQNDRITDLQLLTRLRWQLATSVEKFPPLLVLFCAGAHFLSLHPIFLHFYDFLSFFVHIRSKTEYNVMYPLGK